MYRTLLTFSLTTLIIAAQPARQVKPEDHTGKHISIHSTTPKNTDITDRIQKLLSRWEHAIYRQELFSKKKHACLGIWEVSVSPQSTGDIHLTLTRQDLPTRLYYHHPEHMHRHENFRTVSYEIAVMIKGIIQDQAKTKFVLSIAAAR